MTVDMALCISVGSTVQPLAYNLNCYTLELLLKSL